MDNNIYEFMPEYIQFKDNATVVHWIDGTTTVVVCNSEDKFDEYSGFCAAVCKKLYGSSSFVRTIVDKRNVNYINEKVRQHKEAEKKERREIEAANHLKKIRSLAKRLKNEEEARLLIGK